MSARIYDFEAHRLYRFAVAARRVSIPLVRVPNELIDNLKALSRECRNLRNNWARVQLDIQIIQAQCRTTN